MADSIEFTERAKEQLGDVAAAEIANGFNIILVKIESLEKRLESLEKRFESLEMRMASLETRMENRLESLETRMENRLESLENQSIERFRILSGQIQTIQNRLWYIMGTIVIACLGILVGAGAMIYAALQLMNL